MADPTLKRTLVKIDYSSSDGYSLKFEGRGGVGTKHRVTGEQVPAQAALLAAIEELARLTSLFGFADEAKERFDNAQTAVVEWKKKRTAP